ncbi:helix-turn-helix domain-containing protein [Rhodopseudomonas palustris]|uniref:Helix-turn-helix domain-containing protein n=1 Tax=Rhodopseudomonas palustris TaxID=1076 RepID=A0AAX3DWR1_RHOPL|nr:helix-turn-helix domain-containing protein [Rhodopseudomonas palustris]AVT83110.1 transcriptional regulator [Rhodopseudomonas palustris]UYO39149.1 helix-turn-helix domain-containing protein [Rhodopseudomonas palustris]UYO43871.1 helix-turn-helix domain-containing protein [Rhodopseudomonas palustris]UYO53242.1 helix-turn-helix domain-containing protein [Rhodopseudomonas palustris]
MLNQSLRTPATAHAPIDPSSCSPAEQFFATTGHAGLIASEFTYKKEEEIYGEDEPSEYVYQVVSGAVRSYKLLSDGRRQIGAFYLPGDVFGLESGPTHRLTAEAIVDTTVRLIKRRSLEQAAATDINIARGLWSMTAGELRHAEDHMLLLGRKNAMERVANFLLEMDRRLAVAGMMALPMCRRDIGDYLGLTLETVSRALSQLQSKGILGFSGARQIELRNRAQLRNLDA